ncbi:MAG: protein translocase subunit SecD [Eubacteriales bacterium]
MKNKGLGFIIPVLIFAIAAFFMINGITIYNDSGRTAFSMPSVSEIRFGIDIRGGVEAYFEAEDGTDPTLVTSDTLDAAKAIIELRMDAQNISDREVMVDYDNKRILVRFPWKSSETLYDAQNALTELGQMGVLTFRDPDGNIIVEGTDVESAEAGNIQKSSGTYEPGVSLEFNASGTEAFAEATAELVDQQISIYMDETLVDSPTVEEAIPSGSAVIYCSSLEEAKTLADTINSGSLPFKLVSNSNSTISPTLGQSALETMVIAGVIAFAFICLFMLLVYRLSGFVAIISLFGQIVGQLLILAVSQYTLTLPGIAGIILSIGMGVDANVIISERIKEEINLGKSIRLSIDSGYKKAFSAIIDGNITTAIAAVLLLLLSSGTMISFGFTLLVGVILNLFIGVYLSRIMQKSIGALRFINNKWLYCYKGGKSDV